MSLEETAHEAVMAEPLMTWRQRNTIEEMERDLGYETAESFMAGIDGTTTKRQAAQIIETLREHLRTRSQ